MHLWVLVWFFDRVYQLGLGGICRESLDIGSDPYFSTRPFLRSHIRLGCRIIPHQHHRQSGNYVLLPQLGHFLFYFLPDLGRYPFTIDEAELPPSILLQRLT